jgi:hypothetical protein
MPRETSPSEIIARLGQDSALAWEQHRKDEYVPTGGGDLPAGINGIARLSKAYLGLTAADAQRYANEPYFYGQGVIVQPDEFVDKRGTRHHVGGQHTSVTIVLCDQPPDSQSKYKTRASRVVQMMQLLKGLGADTSGVTLSQLPQLLRLLVGRKPYFQFRTWQGKMATEGRYANVEPRVNHTWGIRVEFKPKASSTAIDESAMAAAVGAPTTYEAGTQPNGHAQEASEASEASQQDAGSTEATVNMAQDYIDSQEGQEQTPTEFSEFSNETAEQSGEDGESNENGEPDVGALLAAAINGDIPSQQRLQSLADTHGVAEQFNSAETWEDAARVVGQAMKGTAGGEGGADDEPGAEPEPTPAPKPTKAPAATKTQPQRAATATLPPTTKAPVTSRSPMPQPPTLGRVCKYAPTDTAGKRGKPVEVEVTRVDTAAGKVDLKSLVNPKIMYKGVLFAQLLP